MNERMSAEQFRRTFNLPTNAPANPTRPKLPNPFIKRDDEKSLGKTVEGKKAGMERIVVCFKLMRSRLLDPDNAAASTKNLIDGLRHAKLLFDDTIHDIILQVEQEKVKHISQERTVITITYP